MIARIWRGVARTEVADEYASCTAETGFTACAATAGHRRACDPRLRRRRHRHGGLK